MNHMLLHQKGASTSFKKSFARETLDELAAATTV